MHKMRYTILVLVALVAFTSHTVCSFDGGSGKKPSANDDIKKILDEKLFKYDQSHRVLKRYDSNFSLSYNKNYNKTSRFESVQNPMIEQQSHLNDFKSFSQGPRAGNEDFYGFSMKFPLKK